MNPHDPLVHPGAHLVYERLGVDDPFSLLGARYQHDTPRAQLAQLAGNAACDLDGIQRELADQTEALIARLQPMARGERPARPEVGTNLVYAAGQLDQLCARKDVAYERLTSVLDACDRIGGLEPHAPGHAQDRHLADAHPSSHSAPSSQHPCPDRPPGTTSRASRWRRCGSWNAGTCGCARTCMATPTWSGARGSVPP